MTYTRGVRLGVVRGISYGLFGPPDQFVPQARALGAGLIRAYVYWSQVEPEPGRFEWDIVDALLGQLDGDEEVWLTVCASSTWATEQSTTFLPPSPAKDLGAYAAFVTRLIEHCAGRVRYWQCDNEPSNRPLLWAGTAEQYVLHLRAMHAAVRRADPDALVVLGGCGYDVFSSAPDSEQRRFFDHLVDAGRDAFDLFSVHLYGEPTRVPEYVESSRRMMEAHGYCRPIVAGEHGGPMLTEFPELDGVLQEAFAAAMAAGDDPLADAGQDTPEHRAMAALYAEPDALPPQLRMLMDGCPPDLEDKRHRIACRQLVVRTVLALDCGIRRLAHWCLTPEVPDWRDPLSVMDLLFGKLPLLDWREAAYTRRPAADTFALLAGRLHGMTAIRRLTVPGRAAGYAFEVERGGRGPLLIAWEHRDWFDGEDEPPVPVRLPWHGSDAMAVDAFGAPRAVTVRNGQVDVEMSSTPLFVSPAGEG